MQRFLKNRYIFLDDRPLGVGGSGNTYLAEDREQRNRRCVIKQLVTPGHNAAIDKIVRERFPREAATLKSLGNFNGQIPEWYDFFTEGDQFYLVQEWIDGRTLRQKVREDGPCTEAEVIRILDHLLPVLDYVHSQDIIHRDIKADNIIMRAADNMPVLIDFGAVKEVFTQIITPDLAAHGATIVIGTEGYAAPEQLLGHPVFASDIYGVGQTAIYLLTGVPPKDLPGDSHTGRTLWRARAPLVSDQFAALLDMAIDPLVGGRYAAASEMYRAIKDFIRDDEEKEATVVAQSMDAGTGTPALVLTMPALVGCANCDYWLTVHDEYCPACSSFNPRHPFPDSLGCVIGIVVLLSLLAGFYLAFVFDGGIAGLATGALGGVVVGLLVGSLMMVAYKGFKQSAKPPFPLNDIEKRIIKGRVAQLGQEEQRLRSSLERLKKEGGAQSQSAEVRQNLRQALEARHYIGQRFKIKLWEIGFLRSTNTIQAELIGWRTFAYQHSEKRLKSLDSLIRRCESLQNGVTRDQKYFSNDDASFFTLVASLFGEPKKVSRELIEIPDGKVLTQRIERVLEACRRVREAVVIQQAALAIRVEGYVEQADSFLPALTASLTECQHACSEFSVDDFYVAFFKLESEYKSLHD